MANKARGFVAVDIGGEKIELSLGLGVLAELEDAFGVESFEEVLEFGQRTSARRLKKLLSEIIKANDLDLTPDRLHALKHMPLLEYMEILSTLAKASNLTQQQTADESGEEANRPLEAASAGDPG